MSQNSSTRSLRFFDFLYTSVVYPPSIMYIRGHLDLVLVLDSSLSGEFTRGTGNKPSQCRLAVKNTHSEGFWKSVHRSVNGRVGGVGSQTSSSSSGIMPFRKRVTKMMPIGVPRVPYRTPKESSWQWVDIWNCM